MTPDRIVLAIAVASGAALLAVLILGSAGIWP